MKDKKEEITKSSYFSLCLSHCIFFCDILLILQLIIQITQLGVITLYHPPKKKGRPALGLIR